MASKENQQALDDMCFNCVENYMCSNRYACARGRKIQKALDDLELKDKALDYACKLIENHAIFIKTNNESAKEYVLRKVKEEQESNKTNNLSSKQIEVIREIRKL